MSPRHALLAAAFGDLAPKPFRLVEPNGRLGEVLPHRDVTVLRGIEGARAKEMYKLAAQRFGITWRGRHYERGDPAAADLPNQAINHAASAERK